MAQITAVFENNTLGKYFEFLLACNQDGREMDRHFCAVETGQPIESPYVMITMATVEMTIHFCKSADRVFLLPAADGGLCMGGLYKDISVFPVARFYCLEERNLLKAAHIHKMLDGQGLHLTAPPIAEWKELISEQGWQDRVKNFRERRANRMADHEMLRAGRAKNTTIADAFLLNSTGCLICDAPADGLASMTTAEIGGPASMISVRLCSVHRDEWSEMDTPLVNYLAVKFSLPFAMRTENRDRQETLDDAESLIVTKLKMTVIKRDHRQITARRESGLVLIHRHEGALNYGYMINGPNGEELVRVDSADHHPVPVGPDHIHPDLLQELPPESSFTMGDIAMDWPLIERIIVAWEKKGAVPHD